MDEVASSNGLDVVTVGTVAPGFVMAPLWIADSRGLFEQAGIQIKLEICGTTDATTEALRRGDIDLAMNSPEGSIADAVKGGPLFLAGGLANRPPLSLIADPRYRAIEDLRGARIGTSSLKEGTRHLIDEMLGAHGLVGGVDYEFVLAGAHPQRWQALQEGTIDAALQLVPFDYFAEEKGFSNLGAAASYVPEFAFACICASHDWADEQADTMAAFMGAMREGVKILYEDPEQAADIAVMAGSGERRHAVRACRELTENEAVPHDLTVSVAAFDRAVQAMRASGAMPEDALYGPERAFHPGSPPAGRPAPTATDRI